MENFFDSLLFDKLFACANNNSVNNAKCAMKGVLKKTLTRFRAGQGHKGQNVASYSLLKK